MPPGRRRRKAGCSTTQHFAPGSNRGSGVRTQRCRPIRASIRAFKSPVRPRFRTSRRGVGVHRVHARRVSDEQQASAPAAEHVLLRCVYLDLIGLPPTAEELRAFLADPSTGADERVVYDLLERPEYGQRWGRHWMDVWGYSDWAGFKQEGGESQRHIWRWARLDDPVAQRGIRDTNRDGGRRRRRADELTPGDGDTLH